jgi:hypothetical protein
VTSIIIVTGKVGWFQRKFLFVRIFHIPEGYAAPVRIAEITVRHKKVGRNDLCWCGSQIKYKKCHLNRDKQEPIKHWEVNKQFNNVQTRELCSCPDSFHKKCVGKIIKAHTIPKSSSLKAIAKDGHVLGLKMSYEFIKKNKGKPILTAIGINQASTFNGFCKYHDDIIFAPLEKERFKKTEQQCFLLAYRAFAKEFYAKEGALQLSSLRHQADRGMSIDAQMEVQMNNFLTEVGTMAAMEDLRYHKSYFDADLENNDFSNVRSVIFTFDHIPPVMVCGGINPDFDFNGRELQDLMELTTRAENISMSSYYDGEKGIIAFSWLKNSHDVCKKLMDSLLEKDESLHSAILVQYMFKNFENIYVSPEWWGTVSASAKDALLSLFGDTTSPELLPNANGLVYKIADFDFPKYKDLEFVNWS